MSMQRDESRSLDAVWREFAADLHRYIASRVSRPEDVDDVLQVVFVRMAKGLPQLRDQDRLLGWLYTLTRNVITDFYRSAAHRREIAVGDVPDAVWEQSDDAAQDRERAVAELSQCLRPMLSRLPADQAAAVYEVDLKGRSQTEVARDVGISPSGMKSRVQRGRAKLRDVLAVCCDISQDVGGRVHAYTPRDGTCECGNGGTSPQPI